MESVTRAFLAAARRMGRETEADAILVHADVFPQESSLREFIEQATDIRLVVATRRGKEGWGASNVDVVSVPDVKLTRLGQIKVPVLLALTRAMLQKGDRIICLTGIAMSGAVDTAVFMEVGDEFEMFAYSERRDISEDVRPEAFDQVLEFAIHLGNEGREGKPVGRDTPAKEDFHGDQRPGLDVETDARPGQ